MKRLILLSLLAGLSFGSTAQSVSDTADTVRIPVPPQAITLPEHASRIYTGGFDTLLGVYDMSNGQQMRLSMQGIRKYAQVGDLPKTEVIATNDYEFVGVNRRFKINLDEPVFGLTKGTVLIEAPSRDLAGAPGAPRTIALAVH